MPATQPGIKPPASQTAAPTTEFDLARKRAEQQNAAQVQQQRDAITRRAAQTGGGVSGALIKQDQLVQQKGAETLANANEGIDTAQRAEDRRVREIAEGREYQTSERLGSQEFATKTQANQFAYGTKEREAGQSFQATQQEKALTAQLAQQKAQIEAAAAEGKLNRAQADKQLAQLQTQFDQEMEQNKNTNAINSILSAHNSGIAPEAMANLLSSLGIVFKNGVPEIPGVTYTAPVAPTVVYRDPPAKAPASTVRPGNSTYNPD